MADEAVAVEAVSDETPLQREHRLFKEHAVNVLHESADRRDLCGTFDEVLHRAGLPGRDSYYTAYGQPRTDIQRPSLIGEATAEEFDAWKRRVSGELYRQAARYDISRAEQTIVRAGFLPREGLFRRVPVVIEGSFRVSMGTVEVTGEEGVIDALDAFRVREYIYNALYRERQLVDDEFTWKAVVDETAPAEG